VLAFFCPCYELSGVDAQSGELPADVGVSGHATLILLSFDELNQLLEFPDGLGIDQI
jgi:hypothetical protein